MPTSPRPRKRLLVSVLLALGLLGSGLGVASLGLGEESAPPKVHVVFEVEEEEFRILGVKVYAWTFQLPDAIVGTVPGPILRIVQGTELTIELRNGHTEPHSFHTHFQNYPISSDGSSHTLPSAMVPHQADDPLGGVGITSMLNVHSDTGFSPIGVVAPRYDHDIVPAGQKREYKFVANEVGTFVYHCHVFPVAEHISRGLQGMIIVYPPGWSWDSSQLTPQFGTGNTDAWVTDAAGKRWYEDVVILSELDLTSATDKALVPTTGETGDVQLVNFRAWADPYYLGPVHNNTPMRIVVGNLGEAVHSFHIHGHNFNVLDKFDPDKRVVQRQDALLISPGQSYEITLEATHPGFWFVHDHINQNSYAGMIGWLHVLEDWEE